MGEEDAVKRLLLLVGLVAAAGAGFATTASADYGTGAVYQIELSANVPGSNGGGVWLWITLNSNGGGDYAGSDCGRGAAERAQSDKGDVTSWFYADQNGTPDSSGHYVVVQGVALNGLGGFPTTITVPRAYGHYTGTIDSFLTLPPFIPTGIGFSQLQVAP
jgi:hypothetical protein